MKALLQRVASASVTVAGHDAPRRVGQIGAGLLVFIAVERDDGPRDVGYVAGKVCELRVFEDPALPDRRMTRSVTEMGGDVLVVSQFTLAADCRRGRRPSFDRAAPPDEARPVYDALVRAIGGAGVRVATGEFQAAMQVELVNDGPVTFWLDSRKDGVS
jgi:D-tyrosyl-tRNA(Tyr) deacylase